MQSALRLPRVASARIALASIDAHEQVECRAVARKAERIQLCRWHVATPFGAVVADLTCIGLIRFAKVIEHQLRERILAQAPAFAIIAAAAAG